MISPGLGKVWFSIIGSLIFCLLFQSNGVLAACSNTVPGITRMSSGVDITTLDLEPPDQFSKDGFKRQLFDITCDNNALWTNPYNDRVYEVPDHVQAVYSTSTGSTRAVATLHQSYEDVQESFKAAVGVSPFIFGMGAGSGSYETKLTSVRDKFHQMSQVNFLVTTTEAQLKDQIGFSSTVIDAINMLPPNSSSFYGPYREFFTKYGTHYIRKAKFGGKIQINFEIKQNYYLNHNSEQIKSQAELSFWKKLNTKFHAEFDTENQNIDSRFEEYTTFETFHYGGTYNILENSGYKEWQPTVAGNPWIISVELEPISNLITSAEKRREFDEALKFYLAESALDELEGILNYNLEKYREKHLNTSLLSSFLERVEMETSADMLDPHSVYRLKDEVYFHYVLPGSWSDFKICLNSYRSHGAGTCYVSYEEKVCAPPEGYTYQFNDNENPPECEIDLGLFTHNSATDEWAKDTELCFAVGGDHCEFATESRCEKANKYLFTGLNKLINQNGNCYVNLTLQNKNQNKPHWINQVQLCLVSYSEKSLEEEHYDIDCAPLNHWVSSKDFQYLYSDCCVVQFEIFYTFPGNEKLIMDMAAGKITNEKNESSAAWRIIVAAVVPSILVIVLVICCCMKCRKPIPGALSTKEPTKDNTQDIVPSPSVPPPLIAETPNGTPGNGTVSHTRRVELEKRFGDCTTKCTMTDTTTFDDFEPDQIPRLISSLYPRPEHARIPKLPGRVHEHPLSQGEVPRELHKFLNSSCMLPHEGGRPAP